jgi:molybdopterin-binding protein
MITRQERAAARGRERAMLSSTARGRRVATAWLDEPVQHLRDVRTELLVKLVLRERAGLESEVLLRAQLDAFSSAIDALTAGQEADLVDVWRREHARAVRRFLAEALRPASGDAPSRPEMRLSARNQLRARVVSVQRGELMASVKAVLGDGQKLTAAITQEATDDLDIAAGDDVVLIVKATEVMVAKAADLS